MKCYHCKQDVDIVYCSNCGEEIRWDNKKCKHCGKPMEWRYDPILARYTWHCHNCEELDV